MPVKGMATVQCECGLPPDDACANSVAYAAHRLPSDHMEPMESMLRALWWWLTEAQKTRRIAAA